MKKRFRSCGRIGTSGGFTLIELLVVIAIIAILAAILFPVFARARERARATACLSNSKQIATAWHMYTQDFDECMPLYQVLIGGSSATGWSWHWQLMPYVKSTKVFICPSARRLSASTSQLCDPLYEPANPFYCLGGYGMNYYYLGDVDKPVSLAAIASPAETVALGETNGLSTTRILYYPTSWNNAGNATCNPGGKLGDGFGSWHFDGNNIVFADGHAKWMRNEVLGDYNRDGTRDNGWFDRS